MPMKRQVFAITESRAVLCRDGTELNHVDYMISQGLLKNAADPNYERIVRGYVAQGQLHCFLGASFYLPEKTPELYSRLRQISAKIGLDKSLPVKFATYGGRHDKHGVASHRLHYDLWKIWTDEEAKS